MDYLVIGKLKLFPIEGAKTLQQGIYQGMPFAVGKDTTEDKLYVIFLPDGQISKEYAEANNLVGFTDPSTGEHKGGFFGKNRKVRSIKLIKGTVTSVGYVADLESLKFTGYDISKLKEGDSFSELKGIPIISKFVNEATQNQGNQNGKNSRREVLGLKMHPDTNQYYRNKTNLKVGDLITITYKLDGTSVRVGRTYESRRQNWFEKLLNIIGLVKSSNYKELDTTGSRRFVIDTSHTNNGFYGNNSIYTEVGDRLKGLLSLGESVYAEIVGWYNEDKPLFNRGGVIFKYGCTAGTRDQYVYAMKYTLPNGSSIQLPWNVVKQRCKLLGLKHVPEVKPSFIFDGNLKELDEFVDCTVIGPDVIDPSHIKEGVVIRVDSVDGNTYFLKHKSAEYYTLEDKAKNDENYIDIEEAA